MKQSVSNPSGSNKAVVITGASAGIGKALALEFAGRGYHLGLTARHNETLEAVRTQIVAAHPGRPLRIDIAVLDVNQDDAVADAMRALFTRMGGVDIVVVNAGINDFTRVGKGQFEKEKRLIQTNLVGAIATVNAAASYFIAQGRGRIVGISSLAALNGMPTQAAYCATKAGFSAYLDAARIELARHAIGVTTILPGFVKTEIVAGIEKYPFVVSAEQAAREIVDAIEAGQSHAAVPAWPWKWIRPFMRLMPDAAWKLLK